MSCGRHLWLPRVSARQIGAHIEDGGSLDDAYYVDQSPYANLDTFEELATKNAGVVYTEMEFE